MKARLVESKLRFLKRAPIRESHCTRDYFIGFPTPKLQASFEAPTLLIDGILEEAQGTL